MQALSVMEGAPSQRPLLLLLVLAIRMTGTALVTFHGSGPAHPVYLCGECLSKGLTTLYTNLGTCGSNNTAAITIQPDGTATWWTSLTLTECVFRWRWMQVLSNSTTVLELKDQGVRILNLWGVKNTEHLSVYSTFDVYLFEAEIPGRQQVIFHGASTNSYPADRAEVSLCGECADHGLYQLWDNDCARINKVPVEGGAWTVQLHLPLCEFNWRWAVLQKSAEILYRHEHGDLHKLQVTSCEPNSTYLYVVSVWDSQPSAPYCKPAAITTYAASLLNTKTEPITTTQHSKESLLASQHLITSTGTQQMDDEATFWQTGIAEVSLTDQLFKHVKSTQISLMTMEEDHRMSVYQSPTTTLVGSSTVTDTIKDTSLSKAGFPEKDAPLPEGPSVGRHTFHLGYIVSIAIGCAVTLLGVLLGLIYFVKRHSKQRRLKHSRAMFDKKQPLPKIPPVREQTELPPSTRDVALRELHGYYNVTLNMISEAGFIPNNRQSETAVLPVNDYEIVFVKNALYGDDI